MTIFPPGEILRWVERGATALCPKCRIDSVIGSKAGFPVEKPFLRRMYAHWFAAK